MQFANCTFMLSHVFKRHNSENQITPISAKYTFWKWWNNPISFLNNLNISSSHGAKMWRRSSRFYSGHKSERWPPNSASVYISVKFSANRPRSGWDYEPTLKATPSEKRPPLSLLCKGRQLIKRLIGKRLSIWTMPNNYCLPHSSKGCAYKIHHMFNHRLAFTCHNAVPSRHLMCALAATISWRRGGGMTLPGNINCSLPVFRANCGWVTHSCFIKERPSSNLLPMSWA